MNRALRQEGRMGDGFSSNKVSFLKAPEYIYLGDRSTDPQLKNHPCSAVRRPDGKCIRGKNGSMLVSFTNRHTEVVIARLLRKIPNESRK